VRFIITFGQVHTHRVAGHTLDADCVALIDAQDEKDARRVAFALFDDKWHHCYPENALAGDFMGYFPRGKIEVPVPPAPAPEIRNLGYANGWVTGRIPESVRKCRDTP